MPKTRNRSERAVSSFRRRNMARKKQADMTLAQRQTLENNKFRAELMAENLEADRTPRDTSDIDKFRKDQYREALRDAKATR